MLLSCGLRLFAGSSRRCLSNGLDNPCWSVLFVLLLVLCGAPHLLTPDSAARAFDYALFFPSDEQGLPPRILQLPILRVPAQGRIGVPIFAFLTGFVCALKPLKLSQHRAQHGEALATVAKSAFRRPIRLVLPAMIATVISFLCTALGGYKAASSSDSKWVRFDAPVQEPTFKLELFRLLKALLTTWTTGYNPYDRHQWALKPLLFGAFQVYIVVAAMVGMRLKYRLVLQ